MQYGLVLKLTEISIADRHSTGSVIAKNKIIDIYLNTNLQEGNEEIKKVEKENVSLEEIDKKMITIDDFLNNLE